jgi:hypothetical protein
VISSNLRLLSRLSRVTPSVFQLVDFLALRGYNTIRLCSNFKNRLSTVTFRHAFLVGIEYFPFARVSFPLFTSPSKTLAMCSAPPNLLERILRCITRTVNGVPICFAFDSTSDSNSSRAAYALDLDFISSQEKFRGSAHHFFLAFLQTIRSRVCVYSRTESPKR